MLYHVLGLDNGRTVFQGSGKKWVSSPDVDFSKVFHGWKKSGEWCALREQVNGSKAEAGEKKTNGMLWERNESEHAGQ